MTVYTERFLKYHSDNPQIYQLFAQFAIQAIDRGRKRLGANMIIERIRWYSAIESKGEEFKINNNYAPDYARMFVANHPQHKDFFHFRERLVSDLVGAD